MLPQIEDRKQIGEQMFPLNDVAVMRRPRKTWVVLTIALIVVATLLASGIYSRVKARNTLNQETARAALPSVSVVSPKQSAPAEEIILPGNVEPYISSPIYSRTNGYLKKWYVDIGGRVKQGNK